MNLRRLLETVSGEPLFRTSLLLAGKVDRADLSRQVSRWVQAGKLLQLRRGFYCLAAPYRKIEPHPFVIANHLVSGSYVSLESALQWHGHIPESVPTVTSVTTGRPGHFETPLGTFLFRHVGRQYFLGFEQATVTPGQTAFVAHPEKALLDLCHLVPGSDRPEFLEGLRLQALEELDLARLRQLCEQISRPKLRRLARHIENLVEAESEAWRDL